MPFACNNRKGRPHPAGEAYFYLEIGVMEEKNVLQYPSKGSSYRDDVGATAILASPSRSILEGTEEGHPHRTSIGAVYDQTLLDDRLLLVLRRKHQINIGA